MYSVLFALVPCFSVTNNVFFVTGKLQPAVDVTSTKFPAPGIQYNPFDFPLK